MLLIRALALVALVLPLICGASPNLLFNSNHIAQSSCTNFLLGAGTANGSGPIRVDATQINDPSVTPSFLSPTSFAVLLTSGPNSGTPNLYNSDTNNPENNVFPYFVGNQASSGYNPASDRLIYSAAVAGGWIYDYAFVPGTTLPAGTPPPVAMTTVTSCAGTAGQGDEFCMPASFQATYGCDVTSPSASTTSMSSVEIALKYQHSAWNNFDVHAALRITAANWSTGYDYTTFGYGAVSYASANALGAASGFYLQPPGMTITPQPGKALITIYPFLQTRRSNEAVYLVPSGYSWPAPSTRNEYSQADITASGGTLIYSSVGAYAQSFYYYPSSSGNFSFVAFGTDGAGHYSRVESWSVQTVALTAAGVACF